ncbi:MAG: LacI family DNA-binding transcriptional regulator [Thermomicrobiales bacterium]
MRAPRVTIRSVAADAGVSITTVSNVLNGRHEQMATETRSRVLDAMDRLGYRPNHVAQSLVTSRTATIGLIMGDLTNALYPPVTIGAEAACRAAGYTLLLANADDVEAERRAVELMRAKCVDGLVLFSLSFLDMPAEHLLQAHDDGTPVVAINRALPPGAPIPSVAFDHYGGARQATRHLIDLGHTRIAHIAGPANRFTGLQRCRGYEKELSQAGISLDPALVTESDYSFESGECLMRGLWQARPTAVFVGGDALALGALRALRHLDVAVPHDLSLVAFGNPDSVRYATPAITTIDLPVAEAGRLAVERVLRLIRPHQRDLVHPLAETEVQTLQTTLLVRDTTAGVRSRGSGVGESTALCP